MGSKYKFDKMPISRLKRLEESGCREEDRLLKKMQRLYNSAYKTRKEFRAKRRKVSSIRYFIGKKKGLKCPAYKSHKETEERRYPYRNHVFSWSTHKCLADLDRGLNSIWFFGHHCYFCKRTKEEAEIATLAKKLETKE